MANITFKERVEKLEERVQELEHWRSVVKANAERTLEKMQALIKK